MLMALSGGVLIGLAALLLYGALGKIAGISGITFGALVPDSRAWRLPFLLGLGCGAWIAVVLGAPQPLASLPQGTASVVLLIAAGVLVGFGTRLGKGCTSGHGICGLSRLSMLSLVAVLTFMLVGIIVATTMRHLWPGAAS